MYHVEINSSVHFFMLKQLDLIHSPVRVGKGTSSTILKRAMTIET